MNISILHTDRYADLSQLRTAVQNVNKNEREPDAQLLLKIQEVATAIKEAGEDATLQVWKDLECPKLITAMLLSENKIIKGNLTEPMKAVLENTDILSDACKQARIALRQEIDIEGPAGRKLTKETQWLVTKLLASANQLSNDSFHVAWIKTANLTKALYDNYPELFKEATQGSTVLPAITDAVRLVLLSQQPGYQNLGAPTDSEIGPRIQKLLEQADVLSTIQKQVGAGSVEEIATKIQELQKAVTSLTNDETVKQIITKPSVQAPWWHNRRVWISFGLGLSIGGVLAYFDLTRRNDDEGGGSLLLGLGTWLAASRLAGLAPTLFVNRMLIFQHDR